jgi:siroheme synthase (precorrin-2 oxidase/ferrochelatase)
MKSYMAILVSKNAIPDHEAWRNEIGLAAKESNSFWWWDQSADEIVFCFDNDYLGHRLAMACRNKGIPCRMEWRERS